MSRRGPSSYQRHPELSRYTGRGRYENPKEDFKTIAGKLTSLTEPGRSYSVVDVGCGNGELLYLLKRRFPAWRLTGYDHTPEFVEAARSFPGLADVAFHQADLFDIEGEFDIVIATCFLSLFPDIERPLRKLVGLCRPGGHVLATGLFNPFDIEVRVEFCDNSRPETRGRWRTDFNRHSQQRIRELLADSVEEVAFEACCYDLDLPADPAHPIRVWSVRDDEGRAWLLNGAWQIANQTLMIARR